MPYSNTSHEDHANRPCRVHRPCNGLTILSDEDQSTQEGCHDRNRVPQLFIPPYHIAGGVASGGNQPKSPSCAEGGAISSASDNVNTTDRLPSPNRERLHARERVADFLRVLTDVAVLLTTVLTVTVSLGTPYWCYRNYRLRHQIQVVLYGEGGVLNTTAEVTHEEQWVKVVKRLESQWKSYHALSAATLPVIFPMLTIYPIPKCSWAFLFATIALLSGLASLVFAMLYRNHSEEFQHTSVTEYWYNASCSSWRQSSTQRFWLIFSLPTIWFLNSISALTLSIVLSVWEQIPITPKVAAGDVCLPWRLHVFKASTLILMWMVLTHLALFALRTTSTQK